MEDKILYINACMRPMSRTAELAEHLLSCLDGKITEINLYKEKLLPIDYHELQRRDKPDCSDGDFALAKQFADADIIVIGAPFWDFSFPSVIKVYFENIAVPGIIFEYSDEGCPIGKCKAKKLYYVATAGGYIEDNNYGFDYVKVLAEVFYGIKDVSFYSAEGLDIYGADVEAIMKDAKAKISKQFK